MNDSRTIARTAINRLSTVLDALVSDPRKVDAVLDVTQPLIAAFDSLIDEIEALKRKVAELERRP